MGSKHVSGEDPHFSCFQSCLEYTPYPGIHTHEFHEFFVCLDGRGEQLNGRGSLPMARGDLFFFPAGQLHIANAAPTVRCHFIVLFLAVHIFSPAIEGDQDADRVLRHLCTQGMQGRNLVPLSLTGRKRVAQFFIEMMGEYQHKSIGFRCAMKVRIQEVLLTLLRDPACAPALQQQFRPMPARERLSEVRHYLQTHFTYPITIEQMADMAHLGRSQFHLVFKEEFGQTLTEYVNELRLKSAVILLENVDLSIEEVAYRSGFRSLSHFYASFKDYYGSTPLAQRRKAVVAAR